MVAFNPDASDRDWTPRMTTRERGVWGWGVPGASVPDVPAMVRKMGRAIRSLVESVDAFQKAVEDLGELEDDEDETAS